MELLDFSTSIWSILPPVLALGLAIVTRKVLLSLSVGIIVGAFMLSNGSIEKAIYYLFERISALVFNFEEMAINWDNMGIILFLLLLGILSALLSVSGSNRAFVEWAQKKIKSKRGAKLLATCLVFVTFIDDYFHSLVVGAIARPVTDKFSVSRAKLAYILDSTAAPTCVMMPVSSWGAYIITIIAGLLSEHAITSYTPFGAFMTMSALNLYAVFALIMVFFVSITAFNIGPMARHEYEAQNGQIKIVEEVVENKGKMLNLVLPIVCLFLATLTMMLYTGNQELIVQNRDFSILGAFENATVWKSLVVGGLVALVVSTITIIVGGQVTSKNYFKSYLVGMRSMLGAIAILFFAWTINKVVGDMQTGKYLSSLVTGNIDAVYLPAILFILGAFMAFSTGTSWGTFGIMLPIAATIAINANSELLIPCLSAVMAGAVCGDHCSPVSDTTILSSTGAKCNHMNHVTTQLPYALVVALACLIGYLVIGFSNSGVLGFLTTAIVLVIEIVLFKNLKFQNYNELNKKVI